MFGVKKDKEVWFDYYTGDNCVNCGRNRVEQSNLRKVCEKCHVNQETKEYEYDLII